ncbi:MAG: hypothetical protein FJW53_07050 [Actinobacteria bacterium]|nr:hypothetical protein [Actinomycetota bacterium]
MLEENLARVCAAAVGAVLAVAGASKLLDMESWRRDARAQAVWPIVANVLPYVEILIGATLVALPPNPATLGAATALLLVFTVFLVVSVATGSTVPCACFGAVRRRPPGWRDVARNLALMSLLVAAATIAG